MSAADDQHSFSATSDVFQRVAGIPQHAVVLVYDLEGFSQFFNQPDVQLYVPQFLNHVNRAIATIINGGRAYWHEGDSRTMAALPAPVHEKFMGDGALYLWMSEPFAANGSSLLGYLCNRLWELKAEFHSVLETAFDDVPVFDVPKRIRFGLASGTIYELKRCDGGPSEYIGFCINLASRLQKYCPELGFIASARLNLPEQLLAEYRYVRVIATSIKGFPREIVIVDKAEYLALDQQLRRRLFAELPGRAVQ